MPQFTGVELVGVTGTFYPDTQDVRFELALELAERYQEAGLPLVAVDSTDLSKFDGLRVKTALERRDVIVLPAEIAGIATQRQQGVAYAVGEDAVKLVSHEPEKTLMPTFADSIITSLDAVDVLVIGRTERAMMSLPPAQRWTERLAGWMLEQAFDFPPDALSGGRGFTATGAVHMADYPATEPGMNNWIYLYDVPLEARAAGLSIGSLAVDLMHPQIMVAQETHDAVFDRKRFDQFKLQLDYLMERPDVKPEADYLVELIRNGRESLPDDPTNLDLRMYLDHIEQTCRTRGYLPTADQPR